MNEAEIIDQGNAALKTANDAMAKFGLNVKVGENNPTVLIKAAFDGATMGLGIGGPIVGPLAAAFAWCPPCAGAIVAYGAAASAIIGAFAAFFSNFSFKHHLTPEEIAAQKAGADLSHTVTALLLQVPEPSRSALAKVAWDALGRGSPLPGNAIGWPIFLPSDDGYYQLVPPAIVVNGVSHPGAAGGWNGIDGYKGKGYLANASIERMKDAVTAITAHMETLATMAKIDPIAAALAMGVQIPAGGPVADEVAAALEEPSPGFFTPKRLAVGAVVGVLGWLGVREAFARKGKRS